MCGAGGAFWRFVTARDAVRIDPHTLCPDAPRGYVIILLDVSDAGALAYRDVACIRIFISSKDFEEGAFACAVWPDQADTVSIGNGERDVTKQSSCAEGLGQPLRI